MDILSPIQNVLGLVTTVYIAVVEGLNAKLSSDCSYYNIHMCYIINIGFLNRNRSCVSNYSSLCIFNLL